MSDPLTNITPKRVDESWKNQVEQEKTKLQSTTPPPAAASTKESAGAQPASSGAGEQPAGDQRFEALMSSLAMEAFIHLGDVPHPSTNRPEVNLQQAKYLIDLLGMLESKTKGNLSAEETKQLSEYLYQLRMRFVEKTQPPIPPPPGSKEAKR